MVLSDRNIFEWSRRYRIDPMIRALTAVQEAAIIYSKALADMDVRGRGDSSEARGDRDILAMLRHVIKKVTADLDAEMAKKFTPRREPEP